MDYQLHLHLLDGSRALGTLRNADRVYAVGETFNDSTATPKRWEVTELLNTRPPTMTRQEIARNRTT